MKKSLTSVLCILSMVFELMQPLGVLASGASEQIDKVNVMMDQNKIYFDVEADLSEDGKLIAALYDGNGKLIEMRSKNTRFGETISLDADENAASHKIMLWSTENNLKPLSSAEGDVISNVSVYGADYDKSAGFVSELGIFGATDREFDKEGKITRAEFACMLCRLLDVADVANAFAKDNIYIDVEPTHWAAGYINLLGEAGIIDELEEDKFNPYDSISYDHAVSALVRALGYEPVADELGGYTTLAADLMLTCGVDKEEFKAKDVVNLVANALNAYTLLPYGLSPETIDDYFAADGKSGRQQSTLLTDMGVYKIAGIITNIGYGEMEFIAKEDSDDLRIDAGDEEYFIAEDSSWDDYLYELVDVYVKEGEFKNYEVVAVLPNENFNTLTIVSDDVISYSQNVIKYSSTRDIGQTKVADIDVEYSRFNFEYSDLDEFAEERDVIIKLIDNTGDGIYDAIVGTQYDYYTVTGIDPKKEIIQLDGANASLDYEEASIILCDENGNKLTLEDFGENDIVAAVSDNKRPYRYDQYLKIVRLTGTNLRGTVENFFADGAYNYAIMDGRKYADMSGTDFKVGESYSFRLGLTGKIIYADIYEGGDGSSASGATTVSSYSDGVLSNGVPALLTSAGGSGGVVSGGSQSGTATFEPTTPKYSESYVNGAKFLSAVGIISDIVSPDTEVTRADFANILCRAMNLEEDALKYKNKNIFDHVDASHYAAGAINLLAEKGFMKALSDNNFCPDTTVKYAHAMCSVVDALGYSPMAKSKGNYPLGYVKTAKQLGVLDSIESEYYLDSKMLVCLINNILDICHMEEISDGEYAVLDGGGSTEYKTYLTENDIYIATGIITGITANTVTFEVSEDSEDEEFERNTQYVFEIDDYNAFDFLHMYCDAYVKRTGDNEYTLIYTASNDVGSVVVTKSYCIYSRGTDEKYIEYYIDPENSAKTTTIKHNIDADSIIYNMQTGKINIDDIVDLYDARVVFIENTGDNIYDKAVVAEYMYGFVESVNAQTHTISVDGIQIELYPESKNITNIFADSRGKKLSISDFEEGDFVAVLTDGDSTENYESFVMIQDLSENKITGIIEATYESNESEYVVINETEYRTSVELSCGDKGDFYIGKTGRIEHFISDKSDMDMGVAYILEATKTDASFSDDKWQIRLLRAGNDWIYDVSDDANVEFDSYFLENSDAFGLADTNGEYLFENASEAEKTNSARLITYTVNYKGELCGFKTLETTGAKTIVNRQYDKSTNAFSGGNVLDENAVVFNIFDVYGGDISCLRDGGKYTGCVLKDTEDKNSFVIITDLDLENVPRVDLGNSETSFAVVKKVNISSIYGGTIIVDYTCNERDGTLTIGPAAIMHGDIDCDHISLGDVIAFIADDNGNATHYAVIATMDYREGLSLSQSGMEAVSNADIQFMHGYIANERKTVMGSGEILTLDVGGETETVLVNNSSTNKYTYDFSRITPEIKTEDFMDHPDMYYYDENDGYTSRVLVRLVDGEMTDIYGYYHCPTE